MKIMDDMMNDDLKRLQNYSVTPDERLWASILATVELEDRNARLKRRVRKGWMLLAVIALLGGFYHVMDSDLTTTTLSHTGIEEGSAPAIPQDINQKKGKEAMAGGDAAKNEMDAPQHAISNNDAALPEEVTSVTERRKDLTQNTDARNLTASRILNATSEQQIPVIPAKEFSSFTTHHLASQQTLPEKSSEPLGENESPGVSTIGDVSSQVSVHRDSVAGEKIKDVTTTLRDKSVDNSRDQSGIIIQQRKRRSFRLYFTVMPTLGYQRIEANQNDNLIVESIHKVAAFSPERLGVRAEAGLEIPVYPKFNVFGGLVYYQREQTVDYVQKQVEYVQVTTGTNGEIITQPKFVYLEKSFEYQVKNLGFQLGINYQLRSNQLLHTMGTGLEFHMALNRKHQPTPDFTNNPSVYVFYNLYYRLQYPADTKLRAVFQPTLNYSFYINKTMNTPFYVKPYGLGLNLGATYHF